MYPDVFYLDVVSRCIQIYPDFFFQMYPDVVFLFFKTCSLSRLPLSRAQISKGMELRARFAIARAKQGLEYFGIAFPEKGDRVEGNVPLTPLHNVGKALLSADAFLLATFVCFALNILTDESIFKGEVLCSSEELAQTLDERKKTARNARCYEQHLTTLTDSSSGTSVLRETQDSEIKGFASYFAVMKDRTLSASGVVSPLARAIFDARTFNSMCKRPPKFDLCAVNEILDIVASYGTRKCFWYSADYTNYYYQIRLPAYIAAYMCLIFDRTTFIPNVMPMGWSWACFLAQALTWGVILRTCPNDSDLGVPDDAGSMSTPPGHMRMKDGTCILVVYDTIFVIGTDEERVKAWGERISRNSRLAQLQLKYEKYDNPTCFGGIELRSTNNGTTWAVLPDAIAEWKRWAGEQQQPTAETLWKALGFLRFVSGIVGLLPAQLGELTAAQSGVAADTKSPLKTRRDYAKNRPELLEPVKKACRMILDIDYRPRHWKSHLLPRGRVWKAASDATPVCEAFIFLDELLCYRPTAANPIVKLCLLADEIMVREAGALAGCIKRWYEMSGINDLLVVICDNQPVLRSFHRGWSSCSEVQAIIASILHILESRRILIVDIGTNENFADIFSRPDEHFSTEEWSYRLRMTLRRADVALDHFRTLRKQLLLRFDDRDPELEPKELLFPLPIEWEPSEWADELDGLDTDRKRPRD